MRQQRDAPFQFQGLDPEAFGTRAIQKRTLGTNAHHLMSARPHRTHERQQELHQREVDVGNLDDLQPTLLIAHFTCWGPSA